VTRSPATITVEITHPVPAGFNLWKPAWLHLYAVLIAVDVLASALTGGGPYKTISCRFGQSMMNGGWASRVRWPDWWVAHCEAAVYTRVV
jgi:hypothetical protein